MVEEVESGHWLCKLVYAMGKDGSDVIVCIGWCVATIAKGGARIAVTHCEGGLW